MKLMKDLENQQGDRESFWKGKQSRGWLVRPSEICKAMQETSSGKVGQGILQTHTGLIQEQWGVYISLHI